MTRERAALVFRTVTVIMFFAAIFVLFGSKLVWDNDFWWHLRSGQYLLEESGFPGASSISELKSHETFPLTSYWLSQVLFFLFFKYFGYSGIQFLKAAVYSGIFYLQWNWMKREQVPEVLRFLLQCLGIYIMLFIFPGERPQIFTFLFAIIVMILLDKFRSTGKGIMLLPFIMLIWANMHPGFFIGLGLVLVYIAIEGFMLLRGAATMPKTSYIRLVKTGLLAFFISFINPDTYNLLPAVISLVKKQDFNRDVVEMQNIFIILKDYHWIEPVVLMGVITLLSVTGILMNFRRADPIRGLILTGVLLGGYFAYRLFALTVVLGIPLIAYFLARGFDPFRERQEAVARGYAAGLIQSCILMCSVVICGVFISEGMVLENDYNRTNFPVRAADFIEKNGIRGKIFNHFNDGAYLTWRRYPLNKVFVDGRGGNYLTYIAILMGDHPVSPEGMRWNEFLDAAEVNIILIPPLDEVSGEIFPLIPTVMSSDEWRLVYYDERDVLFLRAGQVNRDIIQIFNMPKERAYITVLSLAEKGIAEISDNPQYYVSMGLALKALGSEAESRDYLGKAREMIQIMRQGK